MKKFIIFSLVLLFSTNSYSQARVNRAEIKFGNQSAVLNHATGWSYNSTLGEWVEHQNVISSDKKIFWVSQHPQNFMGMQFKTVSVNNTKYYVLIVEKLKGLYLYPEIYADWREWVEIFGYIFSEKQYSKIWDFDTTDSVIKITTKLWTSVRRENKDTLLNLIHSELLSKENEGKCMFPVTKAEVENEEFIRFYLPKCSPFSFLTHLSANFDKEYFEVTTSEFEKLKID